MDAKRLQRIKFLLFLTITIFLFFGFYFYLGSLSSNSFAGKLKQFQSALSQKEVLVDEIIDRLSEFDQSDSLDTDFVGESIVRDCNEKGLVFLVFKDRRLVYWSENSVVIDLDEIAENENFAFISNAWFEIRKRQIGDVFIFGLIKIKNNYDYENQFLKNDFHPSFKFSSTILISEFPSSNSIYTKEGDFLFSLNFPETLQINDLESCVLAIGYILLFILILVTLYQAYLFLRYYFKSKTILVIGFIADVLIVRLVLLYFKFPDIIYSLALFQPFLFASSGFLPSLGDLLLNVLALLAICFAIFKNVDVLGYLNKTKGINRYITSFLLLFGVFVLFALLGSTLTNIITNSSISFDLLNITKIDGYSLVALLCFGVLILSFVLLTYHILIAGYSIFSSLSRAIMLSVAAALMFILFCFLVFDCDIAVIVFIILYVVNFIFIKKDKKQAIKFSSVVYFLIIFSMFSGYIVFRTNNTIEREARLTGAQKLANERDFAIEFMFSEITNSVMKDSSLLTLINRYPFTNVAEMDETINYLKRNYFTGYWDKYDILFTICDSAKVLDIQPEGYSANCHEYFYDQIQSFGIQTQFKNFTYLDYSSSPDNYLGVIEFSKENSSISIFIEVFSRFIPRGLGYPELLMDQKAKSPFNISVYSWAKYKQNELVYNFGKYAYSMKLDDFVITNNNQGFFNFNHFNHLYFQKDKETILVISRKNPGLIDIAAPLSYFFIFYSLLLLVIILIFKRPLNISQYKLHFKRRLQLSIISLVLISFVLIGLSSLFYIVSLNNNKNIDLLKEKSHSVLIELEHKLSNEENLTPNMEQYLSVLLYKLSLVFFSDINLYDLNGTLLATSRAEIFNKGLISAKMNTSAYNQLANLRSSLFIHRESIGDYSYLSAYLPFRNVENQTIAYLNLPYFAKQNELTDEIVTYLTAFINIYVILIAIAVLITLIISNYISKPVQLLKDKISKLKLGNQNEKIDWIQHDEIGSLVTEYNRMVDELAQSAEMLTKSERESAWREMARQIAHEIKNPLTPMKLSVQYLQKAWDDKSPDWEQRLKRFTGTLAEQIDSLSAIATAFSDFAKMPKSNFEVLELNRIIENAIRLFRDTQLVRFEFTAAELHYVLADAEQLHRVFINLINNSIQAITDPEKGIIKISVERQAGYHVIQFSDNGHGIPDDQKSKVFYPNFTTKSGGMGLGLAMVKNIIQNSNGIIDFKTEEGKGTTFIISLPAHEG